MIASAPGHRRPHPVHERRRGSIVPGLVVFLGIAWLVVLCLGAATRQDWLGPVPRHNLELGIDARALFYTEVDIDTVIPAIGMTAGIGPEGGE